MGGSEGLVGGEGTVFQSVGEGNFYHANANVKTV